MGILRGGLKKKYLSYPLNVAADMRQRLLEVSALHYHNFELGYCRAETYTRNPVWFFV